MKILVSIKRVIDYSVKVRPLADGSGIDMTGVKMSINPFDEIALEEAIKLREQNIASEVVVVSIGTEQIKESLRSALAMGADRAIHLTHNGIIEPLAAAKLLKKIVEKENPQLIIMGKQAIDDDASQTGQMLAALLGYGQATFASKIELDSGHAVVTREVDGGLMVVKVKLPCVLTTDLRLNEPRYITLPNIMKAKSKPFETIDATTLEGNLAPRFEYLNYSEPTKRGGGVRVANVAELIDKLKNEAKVL